MLFHIPVNTSQTSNGRSARGRDYNALAGLAVEQEIRGLKELCPDQATSLIAGRQLTEGHFPIANKGGEQEGHIS